MNVGGWTVAATVFYMILFGVPVAIYGHLMEPGRPCSPVANLHEELS